jgi:hypothetical protein
MRFAFPKDDDTGMHHGIPVMLRIRQRSGRYIAPFVAKDYKDEEEVLLPPKTQLRLVTRQTVSHQVANGQRTFVEILNMEEV